MRLFFALFVVFTTSAVMAIPLQSEKLHFKYEGMLEPYPAGDCTHELTYPSGNPYDWTVKCSVEGVSHTYIAHLAVSFYPKTNQGVAAYEILYWVTDFSKRVPNSSSSIWIHNSNAENRMRYLQVSQGIENDNAVLKLGIDLK